MAVNLGFENLPDLSSSTALSSIPTAANGEYKPCRALLICDKAAGQSVRFRPDGTAPTAAIGVLLEPGQSWSTNESLELIRIIEVTAGALCQVVYSDDSSDS